MSGQILELHHSKHHAAYVKGSNDTLDQLAEARDKGDYHALVGLEKTLAFNLSGHVLHSIFWNNLRPGSSSDRPEGELAAAIDEHLGSFDAFSAQLSHRDQGRPGLRLGRPRLGAPVAAPDRRTDLRPPRQRRPGLHTDPGLRRLGTRLLPAVQERAPRLRRPPVEPGQLGRRHQALRRRPRRRQPDHRRPLTLDAADAFAGAQRAAGVIAAKHRGDLAGAQGTAGRVPRRAGPHPRVRTARPAHPEHPGRPDRPEHGRSRAGTQPAHRRGRTRGTAASVSLRAAP